MPPIPIRVLVTEADTQKPQEGPVEYIIASNGAFLSIKNDNWDAIVPTKEISSLLEQKKKCKWKLPAIPQALMYQIIKFFKEVRDKHDTEVAVLLHFGEGGWAVTVPDQEVTGAHVDYKPGLEDRVPGKRMVGTMHSHVDMSAWHSSTDDDDEAQFDGLHVTLGKMQRVGHGYVDVDASAVIRGETFPIEFEFAKGLKPSGGGMSKTTSKWGFTYSETNPSHAITDKPAYRETKVPLEWHAKVKKKKWSYTSPYSGGSYHSEYSGNYYGGYGGEGGVLPFDRKDTHRAEAPPRKRDDDDDFIV